MRESLKVKTDVLGNGMRYYGQYDSSHTTWLSGVGVKVGAIHMNGGMAHFTEHVICTKSRKYSADDVESKFWRYLGDYSGDWNIFTTRTCTFYGHASIRRERYMKEVFDILTSFVHQDHRLIDQGKISLSEMAAAYKEYLEYGVEDMKELLRDSVYALMYEKNPVRYRIDCEPELLRKITPYAMRKFVNRYYVPKNVFLIILGPPFQGVKEIAERYFGDWNCATEPPELDYDHLDDLPVLNEIRPLEIVRDIKLFYCGIGFPTESYLSPDAETIDVLARILERRLYRRLRNENTDFNGGVYRVSVETPRTFVNGMIYVGFATASSDFAAYGERATLEEIGKLKTDLVDERQFADTRERMLDEYYEMFHRLPDCLADTIVMAASNGDEELVRLHDFEKRMKGLKLKRLRDVANKYFTKNYARVLIRPA